jgi:ADP-heptose:LPS heptosyltransferase
LTTQVNVACLAHEAGCKGIDLYLVADPMHPASRTQSYINNENYAVHLDRLFPAFLCLPGTRSVRIVRDPLAAGFIWTSIVASGVPRWPALPDHLRQKMTYPMSHDIINRFHAREGRIPQLHAPRGYGHWARQFLNQQWPGRFIVCINPRQSRLSSMPATTYRDSPLDEWHAFIDEVGARYPEVHFLMLGGFHEWESALSRRPNVSIPRASGLGLAHELALLRHADLFMGASSGFATMATFTNVPYVITDIEAYFAAWAGVKLGAEHYPFAQAHQYLVWEKENAALLLGYFDAVHHAHRSEAHIAER